MVGGDPAFVVCLGAGRDSRTVSADDGDLFGWIDGPGSTRGLLGALAALASTALLREECSNPGAVDEVDGAKKSSE